MSEVPISSPYRSTPGKPVTEAERSRLSAQLNDAFAAGRIDEDAYGARLDALYAARTLGELLPVVQGLPPAPTYEQPGIVAQATGPAPGELAPTRNPRALVGLALAGGAAAVLAVILIVLIVVL